MSDVAISIEGVGKRYRIGTEQKPYKTFREALVSAATSPLRALTANRGTSEANSFWALKDVSFEVKRGEVVGIIGRNGAGKSTLLKILSQITEPTEGKITLNGRVGSLLEVGTGFHPELTGRENIFLNGAILGMTRGEIRAKFDEIVAFSEIEKFIDTPVKQYSSGMYTRLAFAVAANLEPEILIVDEVLAVGDAAFQKKCLGKMSEVAGQGRTVLFVSHNMAAVTRLCQSIVLLNDGRCVFQGDTQSGIRQYFSSDSGTSAARDWQPGRRPGDDVARLIEVRAHNALGETKFQFDIGDRIGITMTFEALRGDCTLSPNLHLFGEDGSCVFVTIDQDPHWKGQKRPKGIYRSTAWIPEHFMSEGNVTVGAALTTFIPMTVRFYERDAISFNIEEQHRTNSARGEYAGPMPGAVRPRLEWSTEAELEGVSA